jgi:O-methyltransferase
MLNFLDSYIQKRLRATLLDWPMDFGLETSVMNDVAGDYHEFGVYKGRSFAKNIRSYQKLLSPAKFSDMRFWAYDSFEGLPETRDTFAPAHFVKGAYSAPREVFEAEVLKTGLRRERLEVVPGFYDKSLTPELAQRAFSERKIAMTYIDCDVYESVIPVFEFITPGLQVGSVIVIDDWIRHRMHPGHGIQRAYNEWLGRHPEIKLAPLAMSKRAAFVVYAVE